MIPAQELRKYDIFLDLEPNELAALAKIADVTLWTREILWSPSRTVGP
jgi:hypothetical protein